MTSVNLVKPSFLVSILCLLSPCGILDTFAEEVEVINAGIGGHNSRNLLKRLDSDVLAHRPDVVVLMVGSNDMLNSGNSVPLGEYEKNLDTLAKRIDRAGAKLMLTTIPPCHVPYLLERHEPDFFGSEGPAAKIARANGAIHRLAKSQEIPLVAIHAVFAALGNVGVSPKSLIRNEANSGSRDGVHPTPEGYRVLATAVFQAIRSEGWAPKRVVCFGDSITFGAHVEGAGTATGETYPAFLLRLLRAR